MDSFRLRSSLYPPPWGQWLLWLLAGATPAAAAAWSVGLPLPLWAALAPLGGLAVLVGVGVLWMGAGVFGRPLMAGPPDRPCVALTFDDGPDPVHTPRVLAELARHGARATFFVIGEKVVRHPEVVAELVRCGHQVENHSYRHAYDTPLRNPAALAQELLEAQRAIAAATGRQPRWFRPPVGLLSPRVVAAAKQAGLLLCGYSAKSYDGFRHTSVDRAIARLGRALRPGAILLLHDAAERGGRTPIAPEVLARLLPLLSQRGLRAVTLDELLAGCDQA
ncbi:MAG: polysaccharide deacetylase family protein [Myxococcales bacterium]|nr:polysaccharide deacetylase family protein [Myxococcota bacterium]MDW8280627.1 polysaccharide deacetylase family protein [Myxococcales bacterium]